LRIPLGPCETADLIGRFLHGKERYPQEWNDFVEAGRVDAQLEPYRKRCYELDPLVNRPGDPDHGAMEELKCVMSELRELCNQGRKRD
jgi:hypothetical protein